MSEQIEKIDSPERLLEVLETIGWKFYDLPQKYVPHSSLNWHAERVVANWEGFNTPEVERFMPIEELRLVTWDKDRAAMTSQNFWLYREVYRFRAGIYKWPLFAEKMTGSMLKTDLFYHFPHVSLEDPTMMAFTPSHEYGMRDRQVRIKVGKYLQRFYSDVLDAERIRYFANGEKNAELLFATTAAEMEDIYTNGPGSCMGGKDVGYFSTGGIHPVRVYEGEFKLAYLRECGDVTARALVHEPSQTCVRAYGDEGQTLIERLSDAGYSKANSWDGATIRAIRCDSNSSGYVLPYLDGDAKYVRFSKSGSHFVITDDSEGAEFECCNQDGSGDSVNYATCEDCGDRCDEDETHYSEYHHITIGECCIGEYTYCVFDRHGNETWVRSEEVVTTTDGNYYLDDERILHAHGYIALEEGGWAPEDDAVEDIEGEVILYEEAVELLDSSEDSVYIKRDQWQHNKGIVVLFDGTKVVCGYPEDDVPSWVEELEQEYIIDDYGTQLPTKRMRLDEIYMYHGAERLRNVLIDLGFDTRIYHYGGFLDLVQNWPTLQHRLAA